MNKIRFGDVLIDTEDIYFSRIDEGAETFGGTCYTCVMFKHGQGERLEGEAKAAFDEWAKQRPAPGKYDFSQHLHAICVEIRERTPQLEIVAGAPPKSAARAAAEDRLSWPWECISDECDQMMALRAGDQEGVAQIDLKMMQDGTAVTFCPKCEALNPWYWGL